MLWGMGLGGLQLVTGAQQFVYDLPALPLRPGAYKWHANLRDDLELIEDWDCVPELIVATEPVTHRLDEWTGPLNVPCNFSVAQGVLDECELVPDENR